MSNRLYPPQDEIFCTKSMTTYKELAKECTNPRLLYKQVCWFLVAVEILFKTQISQVISPLCPDGSLVFGGFARPAFGSIPPCAEMQAKLVAMVSFPPLVAAGVATVAFPENCALHQVVSGELKLPCTEELRCLAKKDQENW